MLTRGLRALSNALKTVGIASVLTAAMLFNPFPVAASQHGTDPGVTAKAERKTPGDRARACILHRESRNRNVPPNSAGASGYYQFTPVAWDATVKRMGKPEWAGRHAYTFTRRQQDRVYDAAWRQGNGRFYWSARWGAPYACFPGDVKGMR